MGSNYRLEVKVVRKELKKCQTTHVIGLVQGNMSIQFKSHLLLWHMLLFAEITGQGHAQMHVTSSRSSVTLVEIKIKPKEYAMLKKMRQANSRLSSRYKQDKTEFVNGKQGTWVT